MNTSLASTLTGGVASRISQVHLSGGAPLDQSYLRVDTGAFIRYTRGFTWRVGSAFHAYEPFMIPSEFIFTIRSIDLHMSDGKKSNTIVSPAFVWCAMLVQWEVPNPDLYGLVDFYVQKEDPHVNWVEAVI